MPGMWWLYNGTPPPPLPSPIPLAFPRTTKLESRLAARYNPTSSVQSRGQRNSSAVHRIRQHRSTPLLQQPTHTPTIWHRTHCMPRKPAPRMVPVKPVRTAHAKHHQPCLQILAPQRLCRPGFPCVRRSEPHHAQPAARHLGAAVGARERRTRRAVLALPASTLMLLLLLLLLLHRRRLGIRGVAGVIRRAGHRHQP